MCVCVCVCVCERERECVCVCVCEAESIQNESWSVLRRINKQNELNSTH